MRTPRSRARARHRARYIFGFDLYDISINKKTQVEVILEKDLVFDLFLSTAIFSGRLGSLTWHPISTACTADRRARRAVTGTYYLLQVLITHYLQKKTFTCTETGAGIDRVQWI